MSDPVDKRLALTGALAQAIHDTINEHNDRQQMSMAEIIGTLEAVKLELVMDTSRHEGPEEN